MNSKIVSKDGIIDGKKQSRQACSTVMVDGQGHANLCCCYVLDENGEYHDPCYHAVDTCCQFDEVIQSEATPDGVVKSSRSRLANPENAAIAGAVGSVLTVLRSDEG